MWTKGLSIVPPVRTVKPADVYLNDLVVLQHCTRLALKLHNRQNSQDRIIVPLSLLKSINRIGIDLPCLAIIKTRKLLTLSYTLKSVEIN